MKVLTLTQPWASLVALGAKRIETRSWSTSYRGPLAIHAAAGLGPVGGVSGLIDVCAEEPFRSVLEAVGIWDGGVRKDRLPRGAIVAVCELVACEPAAHYKHYHGIRDQEAAFGDYSDGRYAWLLSGIRALPEPVPYGGKQRLWEYDGELPLLVEKRI